MTKKERKVKEVLCDFGKRGIFLIHMEESCALAVGAFASVGDSPVKVYKKIRKWKSEHAGSCAVCFSFLSCSWLPN